MSNEYLSEIRNTVRELARKIEELDALRTDPSQNIKLMMEEIQKLSHRKDYYQRILRMEISKTIHETIDSYRKIDDLKKPMLRLAK